MHPIDTCTGTRACNKNDMSTKLECRANKGQPKIYTSPDRTTVVTIHHSGRERRQAESERHLHRRSESIRHHLPLAPFGGAPQSLDETRVVKCVFKSRCVVGISMHIAEKMSIDLSHVDR